MLKRLSNITCVLALALCLSSLWATRARADEGSASLFDQGFRGLFLGSLVGASTGYLIARPGGMHGEDYRHLGWATGVGALAGAGFGVGVGLLDLGQSAPRAGSIILNDASAGTVLGGAVGAIVGSLHMIHSDRAEDILHGATIGVVSGAGAGVVVGLLHWALSPRRTVTTTHGPGRVTTTVTVSQDGSGHRVVGPMIMGRF
jgi:hypothetical protein